MSESSLNVDLINLLNMNERAKTDDQIIQFRCFSACYFWRLVSICVGLFRVPKRTLRFKTTTMSSRDITRSVKATNRYENKRSNIKIEIALPKFIGDNYEPEIENSETIVYADAALNFVSLFIDATNKIGSIKNREFLSQDDRLKKGMKNRCEKSEEKEIGKNRKVFRCDRNEKKTANIRNVQFGRGSVRRVGKVFVETRRDDRFDPNLFFTNFSLRFVGRKIERTEIFHRKFVAARRNAM